MTITVQYQGGDAMTEVNADRHEFKDDVDRFMVHIKKAISLRVEAQVRQFHEDYDELRDESDRMVRDAEYMVYQLIDNANNEEV